MCPSFFPIEIPLLLYNNDTGDARRDAIIKNRVIMNFNQDGVNCGHSSFLTSISIREYPFPVKDGADSELKGMEDGAP
jgi:hypothetical protein